MPFQFSPLGIPVNTLFAISASTTLSVNPSAMPVSASIAGYSLGAVGAAGPSYLTVSSSGVI